MEDNSINEQTDAQADAVANENKSVNENTTPHTDNCCSTAVNKCERFYRGLNIITFIAVIVLFILYFAGGGSNKTNINTGSQATTYTIAFINSDTLMNQYKLFDDYNTNLENRKIQMEDEMASKAKKFEQDVNDFQKKVQSYSISSDQAQKLEADLMKRQQDLMDLKEKMTEELLKMEMDNQTDLFEKIIEALKLYNKDYNYDYILGYSQGSGILYANEKHDITPAIVEILNTEYDNKK